MCILTLALLSPTGLSAGSPCDHVVTVQDIKEVRHTPVLNPHAAAQGRDQRIQICTEALREYHTWKENQQPMTLIPRKALKKTEEGQSVPQNAAKTNALTETEDDFVVDIDVIQAAHLPNHRDAYPSHIELNANRF